ncbi:MAG: ABC transporter permease [Steroidobacterales bacterium]
MMSARVITTVITRRRGLWADAWYRVCRQPSTLAALIFLTLVVLSAIIGPPLSGYAYDRVDYSQILARPGWASGHWFGADDLGRDLFVRTMTGLRLSLAIGLLATAVSVLIGVGYGATAGYLGGRVDAIMMRTVDLLFALPHFFFVLLLAVLFDQNLVVLFITIGAFGWLVMARIVRGQALSLKHREFIQAAIACGLPTSRILSRHIVPNVLGPVVVYATLTIPQMILLESLLSFLGVGVREPLSSVGALVADGASHMDTAPWMLLIPASLLSLVLLAFNLLGDGLRDALDPRGR